MFIIDLIENKIAYKIGVFVGVFCYPKLLKTYRFLRILRNLVLSRIKDGQSS